MRKKMKKPKSPEPHTKYSWKLIVLLGMLIVSIGLNAWSGAGYFFKKSQSSQYAFLDPARNFYSQKDLIIDFQSLREELNRIGENKNISIYFEFLNTGANISVNKDVTFWPASLMKIPIAMAVMKKIEKGEWKLTNELVLMQEDRNEKYGTLYNSATGSRFSIEKLLEEMLIYSDNTARTIFIRNLEERELDEVLSHLGIEDIFNSNNEIGTKKYSIFWRSLFTSSYLSSEHSQKIIEIMLRSSATNYLRQGIEEKIPFSHKIGVYEDIHADSGIVYVSRRPYILTIMVKEPNQQKAEEVMKNVSQKVYSYVSSY